ncbi:unnamed protein product [Clavelina lepadiformis]|uniref:All-trans-retinol 13,14-reductase n=1 Tax=Clavelina lepadiformis TaxID=159417 RepID=A0ABP0F361_CLALP
MDILLLVKGGAAVLVAIFMFKVIWKKLMHSKSKNPFEYNEKVVSRQIVTDEKERRKVLRKAFRPEFVPENLDAIVVGSGIGGLACAGLLARSGKRVLVLEKHDRAGGTTHTYETKGFEFDIGIHVVGDMAPGSVCRCFMDTLTDSQLEWVETHEHFDCVVLNMPERPIKMYNWVKGIKNSKKQLLADFPQEEKAIERFFELTRSCKAATNTLLMLKLLPKTLMNIASKLGLFQLFLRDYIYVSQNSLEQIIDQLTENKDLRTVLTYSFGDYGTLPKDTCFLMHGMLTNHLVRTGCYYPKGGPSEIAYQIIPGIERAGGVVLSGVKVEELLIEGGRACGVKVSKMSSSLKQEIRAPLVISAAGYFNTFKEMLPKSMSEKHGILQKLPCIKPGVSCLQVMVGLKGSPEELGLQAKNFWIVSSNDHGKATADYLALSQEDAANSEIPILFASFPGTKDPTWNERFPNKSTCVIVTFCNLAWFEEWQNDPAQNRGRVYNNFKSNFINQAWEQVVNVFPHLKDKVEYIEGGSPLSHVYYLNSMHGEMYGMDHNIERFQYENAINIRPETSIPGLYLTGQDIFTCGFSGAAFAGLLTASKVLDRYLMFDLLNHTKLVRKQSS